MEPININSIYCFMFSANDQTNRSWGYEIGVRTLQRRTLRQNFTYLRPCGPLVLIDDMIYNYTKSSNKHNQLILWSLLRLDTKILKEACGDPTEARKKKHVIKDRRILIVLSSYFSYFVILNSCYSLVILYSCTLYSVHLLYNCFI